MRRAWERRGGRNMGYGFREEKEEEDEEEKEEEEEVVISGEEGR